MIRTQYSDETIRALADLRVYAGRYPSMGLSEAINTLDNAGVFADLDEQTDYTPAVEILAESARKSVDEALGALDPAEWGDTTRADQFARQTGVDDPADIAAAVRRANCNCGRPDEPSPALHAGTCPVWALHHNLA